MSVVVTWFRMEASVPEPTLALRCVNVSITNRCPLSCAHCGPESGPAERDSIDVGAICAAFGEARARGCAVVNLTGGEPLIEPRVVTSLLNAARDAGLICRITTSAFWATSAERAGNQLERLRDAGLDQLCVSRSIEHAAAVPVDRVVTAIRAARGLGLSVMLAVCKERNYEIVKSEVLARFEALGEAPPPLFESSLVPFGRAKGHISVSQLLLRPTADLVGGCPSVGKNPQIHPDGTVTMCGVVFARHCEALHVSNLATETFGRIVDGMWADPLVGLIASEGPMGLKGYVESHSSVRFDGEYSGICHLCGDILNHPDSKNWVEALRQGAGGYR